MNVRSALVIVALSTVASAADAQTPKATSITGIVTTPAWAPSGTMRVVKADPLAGAFFPPELIQKHQQELGLTEAQRTAIIGAIQATQSGFIEAQWKLEPESATLATLVSAPRVDEQRVIQQIERVLDLERQIKLTQLELLVRIKNVLTVEQQEQLKRLEGVRFGGQLNIDPSGFFRR